MALSLGLCAASSVWMGGVERVAEQWLSVPKNRLLEFQCLLSLGILLVSAWVALFLMVRCYMHQSKVHAEKLKELNAQHAQNLADMQSKPAFAQSEAPSRKRRGIMFDR